jgi:peptide/nickel transport system substrate-binding protein
VRYLSLSRLFGLLVLFVGACAPAAAPRATEAPASGAPPQAPAQVAATQPARTLVTAIRIEPNTLAAKPTRGGATLTFTRRLFNATLVIFDQQGLPQPYLAASMPQLNTDSWRVSADGRMETTYKLKPNLVWHDGQPLTAEDFAFAWRVYATPELGASGVIPISLIEEVVAPDPTTLTIRWRRPYALANVLTDNFAAQPKHVLESALQSATPEAFEAHPYWTQQFVGAGPFKLDRWEPGAFIEGSAFDRHVLGVPKIARLKMIFLPDPNTALANLLSGEVHFSADDSIRFEQGLTLQREWASRNGGSVLVKPSLWRASYVQFRPELLAAPGLLDKRVRKALAMTMDKEGLNEALFNGQGLMSDVPLIFNTVDYFSQIEPAAVKYSYDPNQAQALLTQAGFTRGGDGVWASPTAGRLAFGLTTTSSSQNESELSILGAGWRRMGFDVTESIFPVAQTQDGQARASFPGLFTFSTPLGEETLVGETTASIPRPENRWAGNNRGAWSSSEFDRLSDSFNGTLDKSQRVQLIAQMVRIFSDEVPALPLYFNPIPVAHVSALKGPQNVAPDSEISWNVHLWELQ